MHAIMTALRKKTFSAKMVNILKDIAEEFTASVT
jgi:hypothetical protein